MIFFVLSGFLVGGTVVQAVEARQWSWIDYTVARMTRLWIVLFPAILLTAFWDSLGMTIISSSFYDGGMQATYNSGPAPNPWRYNIATLLGNLTFLQTIAVPIFGSNGPLWSLANEFWYYVLFPLLFCSVAGSAPVRAKLSSAAIALALCIVLPNSLLLYGLIWLFGVAAFCLHRRHTFTRTHRNMFLWCSGVLLAILLAVNKRNPGEFFDFAIGAVFAAMLLPLSQMGKISVGIGKLSRVVAEFSYTLYLTHFPIAAFLACYVLGNQRLMPGFTSAAIFVGLFVTLILYSFLVYLSFERNTRPVRRMMMQLSVKSFSSETNSSLDFGCLNTRTFHCRRMKTGFISAEERYTDRS